MSLVQTLMSGGYSGISASKYSHDNGAFRIATESTEELHDIFLEFYNVEQAELAALQEGVALEHSSYQAVAEAAIGDALTKIKEFFKKLWDKVKAFFANIRRFIDGIFMSGKDFVKKYKDEINKATPKDFTFKMYKYDNDKLNKSVDDIVQVYAEADTPFAGFDSVLNIVQRTEDAPDRADTDKVYVTTNAGGSGDTGFTTTSVLTSPQVTEWTDSLKKMADEDEALKIFAEGLGLKGVTDRSELDTAFFAMYRNGAEDASDKDDIDITSLSEYATAISGKQPNFAKATSSVDKAYNGAIKRIEKAQKVVKGVKSADGKASKDGAKIAEGLRYTSQFLSQMQGFINTGINAWKTAYNERDKVYKQMIVAGLANSRKAKKK